MAVDTIIAIIMSYFIIRAKDDRSFDYDNSLLTKILVRIVATGALTAICSLVGLVLFVRFTDTSLYQTTYVLDCSNSAMLDSGPFIC